VALLPPGSTPFCSATTPLAPWHFAGRAVSATHPAARDATFSSLGAEGWTAQTHAELRATGMDVLRRFAGLVRKGGVVAVMEYEMTAVLVTNGRRASHCQIRRVGAPERCRRPH
jgi:hypothetical protein